MVTRYAVQRPDGRYLALARLDGRTVPTWTIDRSAASVFDSMLVANLIAMDPEGVNLHPAEQWTIVPIAKGEEPAHDETR